MNRRGFISLLAGAAGAPLVPWRGLVEPKIFLLGRGVGSNSTLSMSARRYWSPWEHPNCRCAYRLVIPDLGIDTLVGPYAEVVT